MSDPPPVYPPDAFTVITCVNNEEVYQANMARSEPILSGRMKHRVIRGVKAVPAAYNEATALVDTPYVVYAHQDVVLPKFWDHRVHGAMRILEAAGNDWSLLGPIGAVPAGSVPKGIRGFLRMNGEKLGAALEAPCKVQTLDECCLIARTGDVVFSESNPSYHLFAADACLGHFVSPYAIDAPVDHNTTRPKEQLDLAFLMSAGWLWGRWSDRPPIQTTCCRMMDDDGTLLLEI